MVQTEFSTIKRPKTVKNKQLSEQVNISDFVQIYKINYINFNNG